MSSRPPFVRPTYYQDPGHGWIAVKRQWLHALGIADKITYFSYQRGSTVYLEEDCDMTLFHDTATRAGWEITYAVKSTDRRSPIRSYNHYTAQP